MTDPCAARSVSLLRSSAWLRGSAALALCFLVLLARGVRGDLPQFPPRLPGDAEKFVVSDASLLTPSDSIVSDVVVAKVAPSVELRYYPGQTYEGHPWSAWGDGLAVGTTYYSAIGDHLAPAGNAFVYRFDVVTGEFEQIVDVRSVLQLPAGHYSPGKIHSRLTIGRDGWLYFSTHRGSTRVTTPENHFSGDWIIRHDLDGGVTEVVAHAPLANQCLPTGRLDPERMLFYAGTADGDYRKKDVQFLVYDVRARRVQFSAPQGPYRAMILAPKSGRVYFPKGGGRGELVPLVCYDPQHARGLRETDVKIGLRAASQPTRDGIVYTADGNRLWAFDTRSETAEELGPTVVGGENYITSLDLDPRTERYLYYVPGAHGGAYRDGSPLVQYDLRTHTRKVICFLDPALRAAGFVPMGSYSVAIDSSGETVFVTWNGAQIPVENDPPARLRFNTCALTVIRIPESERLAAAPDRQADIGTSDEPTEKSKSRIAFQILEQPAGVPAEPGGLDAGAIAARKQELADGTLSSETTIWVPIKKPLEDVPISGMRGETRYALLSRSDEATLRVRRGAGIKDAQISKNSVRDDRFDLAVEFDQDAARKLRRLTRKYNGWRLGVVVDGELIVAPVIRAEIGARAMITGDFNEAEARALLESMTSEEP